MDKMHKTLTCSECNQSFVCDCWHTNNPDCSKIINPLCDKCNDNIGAEIEAMSSPYGARSDREDFHSDG